MLLITVQHVLRSYHSVGRNQTQLSMTCYEDVTDYETIIRTAWFCIF